MKYYKTVRDNDPPQNTKSQHNKITFLLLGFLI